MHIELKFITFALVFLFHRPFLLLLVSELELILILAPSSLILMRNAGKLLPTVLSKVILGPFSLQVYPVYQSIPDKPPIMSQPEKINSLLTDSLRQIKETLRQLLTGLPRFLLYWRFPQKITKMS